MGWLILFGLTIHVALAQTPAIQRIDPTNWWVGMKNPNLQLLIYGPNAGTLTYSINYPGVRVVKTQKAENPDFAFLDLTIAPATKPGTLQVVGKGGGKTLSRGYELRARSNSAKGQGVSPADFIYLIMPDRFANGDPANDKFADMRDTQADPQNPYLRHGGDLKGIINHLDYLQELGVTALWLTPVIDNDESLKKKGRTAIRRGITATILRTITRSTGGLAATRATSTWPLPSTDGV